MAEAEEKLEVEGCGFLCVHEKVVEKVQHELPQEETLLRQGMEHVCEGSGGECGE